MTYYSRRQLEALGEPLGESVTRKEGGRIIYGGGGSGGGAALCYAGTTYPTGGTGTAGQGFNGASNDTTNCVMSPSEVRATGGGGGSSWTSDEAASISNLQGTVTGNGAVTLSMPYSTSSSGLAADAGGGRAAGHDDRTPGPAAARKNSGCSS